MSTNCITNPESLKEFKCLYCGGGAMSSLELGLICDRGKQHESLNNIRELDVMNNNCKVTFFIGSVGYAAVIKFDDAAVNIARDVMESIFKNAMNS